jgi:hypothetical protein
MKRAWLASLLLALISAARASAAQGAFDIHLVEPAEHIDVVAGSTIPIVWEAVNAPAAIEEWEAFVSINGGHTYPIRITPHLDAHIQRFNWIVPYLPGAEVSVLVRFGDEREEREFAFPARVRIAGALPLELFRHEAARDRGFIKTEAEDDHGRTLIEWVDGSRDGSDLRHVVVDDFRVVADHEWKRDRSSHSTPAIGSNSKRLDGDWVVLRSRAAFAGSGQRQTRERRHNCACILILTGRLNI